jgi:hypothetical protein
MCFSISSHFYKKIDMNSITVRQLELCNQQKLCFIPIYFNLQVAIGAFDLGQMKNPNYNWTSSDAVPKTEIKENMHTVSFPVPTTYPNVNRLKWFGMRYLLKCYLETLNSSCKVWQLQRWLKYCLSCTKQKRVGLKTLGLVGLWAILKAVYFCFGGPKKNLRFT